MKTIFLSHSSRDKSFVREVAVSLGTTKVWLDEWELAPGDSLFDNIDAALTEIKIVAVFWSQNSAKSAWVKEELAFTRFRILQGEDVRIIPVVVDDTPMPNWLGRLLWISAKDGPKFVARRLKSLIEGDHLTRRPDAYPGFQNRRKELDTVELAYHNNTKLAALILAPSGFGKSTFVAQTLATHLPHLRAIWLDLEHMNSPARFFAALASRIGLDMPADILDKADWSRFWRDSIHPALSDRDVIVLDSLHSASDEGQAPKWLTMVIVDLLSRNATVYTDKLSLIMTSTFALDLPANLARKITQISLPELSDTEIARIIRYQLTHASPRRTANEAQLKRAAAAAHGYPLAADLWAFHASRVGVELALVDRTPVENQLREIVAGLISQAKLNSNERNVLVNIAVMRIPLTVEELVTQLGVDGETLTRLSKMCLFSPRSSRIMLHGLIAKFFVENIATHADVIAAHSKAADFFGRRWRAVEGLSAQAAILAGENYYHLLSAERVDEARALAWALRDEASNAVRDLYRTHKYDAIIAVAESLSTMDSSGIRDKTVLYYYALALGRRDDAGDRIKSRNILLSIINEHPNNRHYMTSFADLLARWREEDAAKEWYMKARAIAKRNDPVPSLRLGELLLRQNNLHDAAVFIEEARKRSPEDPQIASACAQLEERRGNHQKALEITRAGLRRRPDDIPLNHRAGMLFRHMREFKQAEKHLLLATRGPDSPASYTSLADLYIELNKLAEAEDVISRFPGKPDASCVNVRGHIARRRGNFELAEKLFERCRKMAGDNVVLFGSLARLRLDQAKAHLRSRNVESARASLVEADDNVTRGLIIEDGNEILIALRQEAEDLRRELLQASTVITRERSGPRSRPHSARGRRHHRS